MTYIDQRLPSQIELNAVRRELEPGLTINQKANGRVTTNQRFSQSQLGYEITYPPQGYSDSVITAVKNMYRATRGGNIPFRFRDFDPSMSQLSAEVIGTGDGATTVFRCQKSWTVGSITQTRIITKPANPLAIYFDGVLQSSGYTVDYDTGNITFSPAVPNGVEVSITGYFDILVRFDKEYEAEGLTHWLEAAQTLRLFEWNDI